MEVDKLNHVYSLSYDNQIMYYLDDVLFQEDHSELNLDYETPRISELAYHINEFTNKYLKREHFSDEGFVNINAGKKEYEEGSVPLIINNDTSSVYLTEKRQSITDLNGRKRIVIKYILEIDISKDFELIKKDLITLQKINNFFDLFELMSKAINVRDFDHLFVLINGARIDFLVETKWSFMVMEYCHLRKYAFLSQERAKIAIEKIYAK